MKRLGFLSVLLLSYAATAEAVTDRTVTLHPDGAQIEQRENAKKGYLEITVPPTALQDSLRIVPDNGVELRRVVTLPLKPAGNVQKELGQLAEREELLRDRLKALSVREDIFKAAAKSQSAKAPRRTKTNPEPLSSIKQGTDYAITQLETVYHAKRKAEKELTQIAERRLQLGGKELSGGTLVRIWITPAAGSVTALWNQPDRSWLPSYQVMVGAEGGAVLSLRAENIPAVKGEKVLLVLSPLQSGGKSEKFRYENQWTVVLKESFTSVTVQEAASSPLKISLANSSAVSLPPGEISCFKGGVYHGKGTFPGGDVGRQIDIVCGSR